jgi:hypothetical protein
MWQIAEAGDASVADADIGHVDAVVVGDGTVLEDRVVVRHVCLALPQRAYWIPAAAEMFG